MKICKHFDLCGGCKFQDVPYSQQVENKEKLIKDLVSTCGFAAEVKPVNFFDEWFYRGKMEFTFGEQAGRIICGLHNKKEKRKVVDVEECLIFSPDAGKILERVKNFAREKNYSPYDKFSHRGFLRNLILRETKFTGQLMAAMVVTGQQEFAKEEFIKELKSLDLRAELKSIYLVINDSWSDAVVFEKKELIYGEPFIQEELNGIKFKIGVDSFFQTNSKGTAQLYKKIKSYAQLKGQERVMDLFCGAGSIGIFLAPDARLVLGVEVKPEIVDTAKENAALNNVKNITFFIGDVRKFLNTDGQFYKDIELLVINPPRSGLSPKIIRAILRLNPAAIVYSSCNPDTLFADLAGLRANYQPQFFEPFDFFPHTLHLECLTLLKRA